MRVSIPDDIIEVLETANPHVKLFSPTGQMSQAFQALLKRMVAFPAQGNLLPVYGDAHARLQDLLGLGALRTQESLVDAVQRLYDVKIGEVRIDFTPSQKEELQRRAERSGRTVEEEITAVVRGMHEQFFSQPIGA